MRVVSSMKFVTVKGSTLQRFLKFLKKQRLAWERVGCVDPNQDDGKGYLQQDMVV